MVVDTSALMAILFGEPDAKTFSEALLEADHIYISVGTRIEASLVALGKTEVLDLRLAELLETTDAVVVPLDQRQVDLAMGGLRKYGKGRHSARLNLGDSFAYALATHLGEPLLFKGTDFAQTDVKSALSS